MRISMRVHIGKKAKIKKEHTTPMLFRIPHALPNNSATEKTILSNSKINSDT